MSGSGLPRLTRAGTRLLPAARAQLEHGQSTAEHVHSTTEQTLSSTATVEAQLRTEDVFRSRSVRDLLRTVAVYQVCAVDRIVDNSLQVRRPSATVYR